MNTFISYSGSSIPVGNVVVSFPNGTITFGSIDYFLSGQADIINSISINTSVQTELHIIGKKDSIIVLPANKYITISDLNATGLKIKSSSVYNIWFCASTGSSITIA